MIAALLTLTVVGYAATYYMLWAVIKENRTLRVALLQVSRPEVAAVVRSVEQPATDEPEEPVRKVIYR